MRLVNNNFTLQLSSISEHIPPIAFTFPSPILPDPYIIPDQFSAAHVIVCTVSGSVYRLVLPVPLYWNGLTRSSSWYQEHIIKTTPTETLSSVHVCDPGLVLVALKDGNILKLQAQRHRNGSGFQGWTESILYPSSGLLPSLWGSRQTGASDIVAFASAPSGSFTEVAFTLSRDRQLRVWKDKCIGSVTIPSTYAAAQRRTQTKTAPLLPPSRSTFIRVLSPEEGDEDEDDPDANRRIVVFVPTATDSATGPAGFFIIYQLAGRAGGGARSLEAVGLLPCSARSAQSELRDFIVIDEKLYCLWDKTGAVMVEHTDLPSEEDDDQQTWHHAVTPLDTPGTDTYQKYFEDLVQQDGSLTEAYMAALLRPGFFSRFTLETALAEYRESLYSIPGQHNPVLAASYPTLSEHISAVVGCSVDLGVDPQTGEHLWAQYWNALKRDWEGFMSRCTAIERSARWPLALGVGEGGHAIVLDRERLGIVTEDDEPVAAFKELEATEQSSISSDVHVLLESAVSLEKCIPRPELRLLHDRLVGVTQETIAFSYDEIAADIAARHLFPHIPPNAIKFTTSRLKAVNDLPGALMGALDVILGLDPEIKGEAMEEEFVARGSSVLGHGELWGNAEWPRALVATYVRNTITTRRLLCLKLTTLAVYLVAELPDRMNDPFVMGNVLQALQALSILHHVVAQPAGHLDAEKVPTTDGEDFLSKFDNMRVSSVGPSPASTITYSLIHTLLPQGLHGFNIAHDAQRYIRSTQLLVPVADRSALAAEASLIQTLLVEEHVNLAREIAGWLPLAPGIAYVLAKTWLESGRAEEAVTLFERVAKAFGGDGLLENEDTDALRIVLPPEVDDICSYYQHIVNIFDVVALDEYVVLFAQHTLDVSDPEADLSDLWDKRFKALVALGLYEEAYITVVSLPSSDLQVSLIRHLVSEMCAKGEVDRLTRLNFVGFQQVVETALAFKARNATDPLAFPNYAKVLYAWHVWRGDYRSAGEAMLQQARRIGSVHCTPDVYIDYATEQTRCYLAAINCLSLVDPENAWVALPESPETAKLNRRRRKAEPVIPNSEYTSADNAVEVEVVELADIRQEYMLVLSRLSLAARYPRDDIAHFIVGAADVVSKYIQEGAFDDAISSARALNVSMTPLFENLTARCVHLSSVRYDLVDDIAPWLMRDRMQSWGGTLAQRSWRYLQECLERNDSAETDFEYYKVVLGKILEEDRTCRLPTWLVQFFQTHQPEYLIRLCYKYSLTEDALRYSIQLVKETQKKSHGVTRTSREPLKTPNSAWLPYTLLDTLLDSASLSKDKNISSLALELRKELTSWQANAKKLTAEIRRR